MSGLFNKTFSPNTVKPEKNKYGEYPLLVINTQPPSAFLDPLKSPLKNIFVKAKILDDSLNMRDCHCSDNSIRWDQVSSWCYAEDLVDIFDYDYISIHQEVMRKDRCYPIKVIETIITFTNRIVIDENTGIIKPYTYSSNSEVKKIGDNKHA